MIKINDPVEFVRAMFPHLDLEPWQQRMLRHFMTLSKPLVIPRPRMTAADLPQLTPSEILPIVPFGQPKRRPVIE